MLTHKEAISCAVWVRGWIPSESGCWYSGRKIEKLETACWLLSQCPMLDTQAHPALRLAFRRGPLSPAAVTTAELDMAEACGVTLSIFRDQLTWCPGLLADQLADYTIMPSS